MVTGGHLGFLNSENLSGWQRPVGRDASPC